MIDVLKANAKTHTKGCSGDKEGEVGDKLSQELVRPYRLMDDSTMQLCKFHTCTVGNLLHVVVFVSDTSLKRCSTESEKSEYLPWKRKSESKYMETAR
jgi:hypothetical protein